MTNNTIPQDKTLLQRLPWRWRIMTNRLRLFPDFIIIGVQRGGTTSLYNYLIKHPQVTPAARKEVSFFDRYFGQGVAWYRAHFVSFLNRYWVKRIHGHNLITGESSPYYVFHPLIPGRVAGLLPQVKLIVMLRNPVDRAYSHYWHMVRLGHETLSFEEALEREPERLQGERKRLLEDGRYDGINYRCYSYVARGIYVDQLEAWEELFPKEQLLILCSEDFYASPAVSLKQVFEFLNLPNWDLGKCEKYNQAIYPPMYPSVRKQLIDYFQPHNTRLYRHLGTCFHWE